MLLLHFHTHESDTDTVKIDTAKTQPNGSGANHMDASEGKNNDTSSSDQHHHFQLLQSEAI